MALPPVQIKDLTGIAAPSLDHRIPAQLPTGETRYLTVDQILALLLNRDVQLGDVSAEQVLSRTGDVRSKATDVGDAVLRFLDDLDATKAVLEWLRSDGKVKLVRSAGGELTLQGNGVNDLLWGGNKIYNAGNFVPVAERISSGTVSTTTTAVDITLPTGYRRFLLAIEELVPTTDAQGYPSLRFKVGGVTIATGYRWAARLMAVGVNASYNDSVSSTLTTEMLLNGSAVQSALSGALINSRGKYLIDIFPGGTNSRPSFHSHGKLDQGTNMCILEAGGDLPTQLARAEGVQFRMYNNTIAQVNWELQGVVA